MRTKTKGNTDRRVVRYGNYDDFLNDAERCTQEPVRTLRNWSQAQIYSHLAMSFESCIDGTGFVLPAPVRWLISLLMKRKFLYGTLPAGYKAPATLIASDQITLDTAMTELRRVIQRVRSDGTRAIHPAFGDIGREGWDLFNLRHAELHMSFLQPLQN